MKMDSLDEKLIQLLGQDARQSSNVLAKQLKVSPATIRRRVRTLVKSGALRIVGVVDPKKFGFPLVAVLALDVVHDKVDPVMKMLADRPEVRWISLTTGRFDIMALVRFRSTDELAEFVKNRLSNIEGLRNSETFLSLHVEKGHYARFYRGSDA